MALLQHPIGYKGKGPFGKILRVSEILGSRLSGQTNGTTIQLSRMTNGSEHPNLINEIGVPWPNQEIHSYVSDLCKSWWQSEDREKLTYKGVFLPDVIERQLYIPLYYVTQAITQLGTYLESSAHGTQILFHGDRWLTRFYSRPYRSKFTAQTRVKWLATAALGARGLLARVLKPQMRQSSGRVSLIAYRRDPDIPNNPPIVAACITRGYREYEQLAKCLSELGESTILWCNESPSGHEALRQSADFDMLPLDIHENNETEVFERLLDQARRNRFRAWSGESDFSEIINPLIQSAIKTTGRDIKKAIDAAIEIVDKHSPKMLVVGLTDYWLFNALVQVARQRNIPVIWLQDAYMIKGVDYCPEADYALVESQYAKEVLTDTGFPPEKVFITGQIRYDLMETETRQPVTTDYCQELCRIAEEKTFLVLATDPGNLVNTPSQKLRSELEVMRDVAGLENFHLIVKLHPQDDGTISRKVLELSGAQNVTIVADCDIHRLMQGCALWISKYSTTVIEALIYGKYVLLMDYDRLGMYQDAVDYGVASYLRENGDLRDFLLKWSSSGYEPLLDHPQYREYLEYQCYRADGLSTQRVANKIKELCAVEGY